MNIEALLRHHGQTGDTDKKVGYFLILIGGLGLAGWLSDLDLLRSWFPGLPEMRINNAFAALFLGVMLINHFHLSHQRTVQTSLLLLLFINGCVGMLDPVLPNEIRDILKGEATAFAEDGEFIFSSSGFCYLLMSFVILFSHQQAYGWRLAGQLINFGIITISGLTILGYLFQDPGLYILTLSQGMSIPTALCFNVLAITFAMNEHELGLGKLFNDKFIGNALARIVFPATVGTVIILATIFIFATQRHWFEPQSTMTILVSVFILSSLFVTWYIVKITNQLDYKRQLAREELEQMNFNLEKEIKTRTHELSVVTQRLDYATKGAEISIWEWDVESNMVSGNSVFFDLFGIPSELGSVSMSELINYVDREDLKFLQDILQKIYKENHPLDVKHRLINRDGEERYVQLKGFAQRNDKDRVTKIYGAHWDITAQEKTQITLCSQAKALETLSNRLLFATKGAKIGVWEMELSTQIVVWNDQMYSIYDIEPEEFNGTHDSWVERVHPEDFAKLSTMEKVIAAGNDFEVTFRIYHKDGSLHAIKSNGFFQFENGKPIKMVGTNIDISEQVLAQTALQESYELNKRFVDQAPSAIAMFDNKMNYLAASNRWRSDYGILDRDIIGCSHYDIFPDLPESRKAMHRECLSGVVLKNDEEKITWLGDTSRYLSWEMRPWYTHDSEIGGLLLFTADVTERREHQIQLKENQENLEKLSIKLLRQNKLLADFAHITSHNLRAPVGNLNTLRNFYLEANTWEEKELIFSKFNTVVDHITTTLQELVTALRIKEDTHREMEELPLEEIFEKIKTILFGQIVESKAVIKADFREVPTLKYNRIYLESIFQNLLSNALKYRNPDKAPEIRVWAKLEDGKPALYCEDNGLGIDLDKHGHKIFGLHKTFHRHPDAHGVGLFLTKTQVEALAGEISVESTVNKGSTFIIKFNHDL